MKNYAPRSQSMLVRLVTSIVLSIGCIGCLGFTVYFYNLDAADEATGRKTAEEILQAIQNYKRNSNSYPESLHRLTPGYISSIPQPDYRHEYCYDMRSDGQSFTLAFVPRGEAIGDGWYFYSSILGEWVRSDSDFSLPCHFTFDHK